MIEPSRLRVALLCAALAACASPVARRPGPALWTPQSAAPSALTHEVVDILSLHETCDASWWQCAEAVERAAGPLQPATRAVTAAEAWFYAGSDALRQGAIAPHDAATAYRNCAAAAERVLFSPALTGRSGPLLAPTQRAFRLYNECSERWLLAATGARDGNVALAALSAVARLDWRVRRGAFPREAVDSLDVSSALSIEGLRNDQRQDGIGVALVARTLPPGSDASKRLMPRVLPVTALPRFADTDRPDIELYDAFDAHSVATAFGGVPLAVDYSAAFNAWARKLPNDWAALMAMLSPPPSIAPELELLQPYDPAKVPVILIHGLASGPRTWIDLANDLLGDPRIGPRIQIWTCRYVTSLPLLANRLAIATMLTDALRTLDPEGDDFAAHNVVLIGHSMGGVIARLLVSSSEMQLWDAAFTRPPAALEAKPEDRASAKAIFLFEPWRPATRTIWIAAPHRGTPSATSWRGRVARVLMAAPTGALGFLKRLALLDPEQIRESVRESYLDGGPLSVDTLSSSQAVSGANASLPIASTVSVHSIVGVLDASAPEPGDGYVPLESTLWSGERSRLVIESGHEVHRQPAAILEIKRILLEQLAVSAPGDASARP